MYTATPPGDSKYPPTVGSNGWKSDDASRPIIGNRVATLLTQNAGLITGISAFIAYALTLSRTFTPGESVIFLARHLGADPFPVLADPLWSWCMRLLAALSGSNPLLLNLFSAACVAAAAGLLTGALLRIRPRMELAKEEHPAGQLIAALAGGWFFAFSTPVWLIATRAHPLALDALIVTAIIRLFAAYAMTLRPRLLYSSAFLFGIGLVEFSTLYLLAPVFAVITLLVLQRQKKLNRTILLRLAGCILLGMTFYLPAALQHVGHPSLVWREIDGPLSIFVEFWREQYVAIKFSLPKVGWLTTGLLTCLPAFLGFLYRIRSSYQSEMWLSRLLLIALMLLGLSAVFLNAPLAPWMITKGNPPLITPYLLAASAYSLLIAHVLALRSDKRTVIAELYGTTAMTLIVLTAGVVRTFPMVNPHQGEKAIEQYIQAVLDSLDGRTWLITSGELDANLALEARRQNIQVRLLNPSLSRNAPYRAYYASVLPDARLSGLIATAGFDAMINLWSDRPEIVDELAILGSGDWWSTRQLEPKMNGLLFHGAQPGTSDAWIETEGPAFLAFWEDFRPHYEELSEAKRSPFYPWFAFIRSQLGRIANNLGVVAEDAERDGDAERLYRTAQAIDPGNISARVNLFGMNDREAQIDELRKELEQLPAGATAEFIRRVYGEIRLPARYAVKAMQAIRKGDRDEAARKMELLRETSNDPLLADLMLGQLHQAQRESALSEESYRDVLAEQPGNLAAMTGLFQLALANRDIEQARSLLENMRNSNLSGVQITLAEANLARAVGHSDDAESILEAGLDDHPESPDLLLQLMQLAATRQDAQRYAALLEKLKTLEEPGFQGRWLIANTLFAENNPGEARRFLMPLLARQPGFLPALRLALEINVKTNGDQEERTALTKAIITQEPSNPMANYMMAGLLYDDGRLDEAIASLRVSLSGMDNPAIKNDLAYMLNERGETEEASNLIREVIQAEPSFAPFWNTLALIQLNQDKIEDAWASVARASEIDPRNRATDLVRLRLHLRQNNRAEAEKIAQTILAEESSATDQQKAEARDLMR